MLSNKQSLILTALMAIGLFVFGVLDILDNFLILTALTLIFFAVIINIFYTHFKNKEVQKSFKKQRQLQNE